MRQGTATALLWVVMACSQPAEAPQATAEPRGPSPEPAAEQEPAEGPAEPAAKPEPAPEPAELAPAEEPEPEPATEPEPASKSEPASKPEPEHAAAAKATPEPKPTRPTVAAEPPAKAQAEATAHEGEATPRHATVEGPCGEKGQPMCPLQGWMDRHVQTPLEAGELAKVASAMRTAATFSPNPAWNQGADGWPAIAREAAAAAEGGDTAAVKTQCKRCHKTFRKQYKTSYRLRTIP